MKITLRALALLFALLLLGGCGHDIPASDTAAFCSRKETVYTVGMFRYTLATVKTRYLADYYEKTDRSDAFTDLPALWEENYDNLSTVGDVVRDVAITAVKNTVYFASVADEMGYVLTKNQRAAIDRTVLELASHFEDEDAFSDYLAAFGMTKESLIDYYTLQSRAEAAQQFIYNETTGFDRVTEEEAKNCFDTRFATVEHLFLAYEQGFEQKRDEVKTSLENGASLRDFASYSADGFFTSFPNGMLLFSGSTGFTAYENAALALKVGQFCLLNDTDGVYIIRRLPNDPDAYDAPLSETGDTTVRQLIQTLLISEKKQTAVDSAVNLITDLAQIKHLTVASSPLIR